LSGAPFRKKAIVQISNLIPSCNGNVSHVSGNDRTATPTIQVERLKGLEVRMPFSCSKCGCVTALIQTEANRLSLRCASCRAHLDWISSLTERFLQKIVERFGLPTKPIQVHHNSLIELSPPTSGASGTTSIRAPRYMEK
jgi:hypothetical protein